MAAGKTSGKRRAIFLDRDGVLVRDKDYVYKVADLEILPGVPSALKSLRAKGFLLISVTNQSGIGRGYYSLADTFEFHRALQSQLAKSAETTIDAFYICPHHPEASVKEYRVACSCRKPGPQMVLDAAKDWDIDLAGSYFVGDKTSDIDCAIAAGVRGIQVMGGGKDKAHPKAIATVEDLAAAVKKIS